VRETQYQEAVQTEENPEKLYRIMGIATPELNTSSIPIMRTSKFLDSVERMKPPNDYRSFWHLVRQSGWKLTRRGFTPRPSLIDRFGFS
jgi:hypothetical protein